MALVRSKCIPGMVQTNTFFLHRQGAHRHNHELGYPFSRLDLIGLSSQVAQAHTDFSPVVAVDNPDPIGQRGRCISSFFPASPEPISRSVRQNRFKSVAGLVGSLGTKQNDKSGICGGKI